MIDWRLVTGLEWDGGNPSKSSDKNEVSQTGAEQLFFNEPLLIASDEKHSHAELQMHALGITDGGRLLHVTFTLREQGSEIRVISARTMSRKERHYYDGQT
jgi:uncharacterized protein